MITRCLLTCCFLLICVSCKKKEASLVQKKETAAKPYTGKRVLEIDAYHEEFEWTASITRGVRSVMDDTGAEFRVIRLDTKRNSGEEFKRSAALRAMDVIKEFKPDVVIASDDNVAKYLITPYYRNKELPFVFCGVNWTTSEYGFPYSNVTGQIEVTHVRESVALLRKYSKGGRIGILISDTFTEHKDVANFKKVLGVFFEKEYYVSDLASWKGKYVKLQGEVDMAIIGTFAGFRGVDREELARFAEAEAKIPSSAYNRDYMPFALIGVVKDPEEIGVWSAKTALRILDGTPPSQIPIESNRNGRLYLNMSMAKKLGIKFPIDLIERARFVRENRN